jgi:hypothetical protein
MTTSGIDALLQRRGKGLTTGQELRLVIVKASGRQGQADPMDSSAPKEDFPLIAKFGESTVKPDFTSMVRLHQQNVPGYKVRKVCCYGNLSCRNVLFTTIYYTIPNYTTLMTAPGRLGRRKHHRRRSPQKETSVST